MNENDINGLSYYVDDMFKNREAKELLYKQQQEQEQEQEEEVL